MLTTTVQSSSFPPLGIMRSFAGNTPAAAASTAHGDLKFLSSALSWLTVASMVARSSAAAASCRLPPCVCVCRGVFLGMFEVFMLLFDCVCTGVYVIVWQGVV